jgi:hypothetical protein
VYNYVITTQCRAARSARLAHNQKAMGSNPITATNPVVGVKDLSDVFKLGKVT